MTKQKNLALVFKKIPTAFPVPGEHLVVEDIGFDPSLPAPHGGVVVENLYASFEPYMRGLLRAPETKSYFDAYPLGQPIQSRGLGRVLKSGDEAFREGDIIVATMPIQQYSSIPHQPGRSQRADPTTGRGDIRDLLGALGIPGRTAYTSLYEIGKPKKGETILVSAAAGAVGQLVGLLAKHEGLTVIGSVGSDEKLNFILEHCGYDSGFNYKKEKVADALARLAPQGLNIYYENVGGEQLEAALDRMNNFGRIVVSGMISQYNLPPEEKYGIKNLFNVVSKRLTFRGFIVSDPDFAVKEKAEFPEKIGHWLKDGTFDAQLHETLGIEKSAEGFLGMLKGDNFGKAILKIKLVCYVHRKRGSENLESIWLI